MLQIILLVIVVSPILLYIASRITCGIAKGSVCLNGKTALVVGGNAGIGFETCLLLASRGCRVILADKDDSTQSRLSLIKRTNNPNIISKQVDLSSFKSVRRFASEILDTEQKLDILINNAGIAHGNSITEDGLHLVMQVNYFSHFLLIHLLIDLLKKSASARIVVLSSLLSFFSVMKDAESLAVPRDSSGHWGVLGMYADSKLAMIIASDILAEKLKGTGITCNSLHPGVVHTNIYKSVGNVDPKLFGFSRFYNALASLFGKTPWEGAQTTFYLATDEDVEGVTGEYFIDCHRYLKPNRSKNKEFCKKIFEKSEETVKLTESEKIRP